MDQFSLSESLNEFQSEKLTSSNDVDEAESLLQEATNELALTSEAVSRSEVFQPLLDLALSYLDLSKKHQNQLVDLITSAFRTIAESLFQSLESSENIPIEEYKQYLEMYGFLTHILLKKLSIQDIPFNSTTGKRKGSEAFNHNCKQIELIMDSTTYVFKIKLSKLFVTTPERDLYIGLFTRPIYILMENENRMKSTTLRMHIFKILCMAIKYHGHASDALISIIQNLTYFVHLTDYTAEFLQILNDHYDHQQLTEELLQEVSNKTFNSNDSTGPKSIAAFITKLSELIPKLVMKQMTLLVKLLDNNAYNLRSAVVEVCGNIIIDLSNNESDLQNHNSQIDQYFDIIEERFMDINPYVRMKSAQILSKLCDLDVKFTNRRHHITELAINGLNDKSSFVRRNSIKLLAKLILTHPFGMLYGTQLNGKVWGKRLIGVNKEIKQLELESENVTPRPENEEEQQNSLETNENQQPNEANDSNDLNDQENEKLMKLKLTAKYITDAIKFIQNVEQGLDSCSDLLSGKNKSEIREAMDIFIISDAFAIQNSPKGIRKMLHLVWLSGSNEEGQAIAEHLIECYQTLYFVAPDDATELEAAAYISKNLISLTYGTTTAELTSLERLLCLMMDKKLVSDNVVKMLWDIYSFQKQDFSILQRRGAIIILGMLALADNEISIKGLDALLRIGLGPKGKEDLQLARFSCIALQRVVPTAKVQKKKEIASKKAYQMTSDHQTIQLLTSILLEYSDDTQWYPLAEEAIDCIYAVCQTPDDVSSQLIKEKTTAVFGTTTISSKERLQALAQLLFITGHTAIKTVIKLEEAETEFKRRKIELESAKKGSKKNGEDANELEMIGGTSEDDFTEAVTHIKEKEILFGEKSLLARFGNVVREICLNKSKYNNELLQKSAVLCLCKFMCVSSRYCEANLPVLITIMERSQDPIIRSNAAIGLGDISVCFNNLVGENTDYIYRRLYDDNIMVQRTCLMIVTFLILAGQVKVKGQLSHMAKFLEHKDQKMADMSRMFFTELSTKDNAIYNGFIDIFSGLINDETLNKDSMKRIVKFLLSFIEKEKHQKQLCEKLIQRLSRCDTEAQWNDVAYVLNSLPYKNEAITNALSEGFKIVSAR